MKTFKPGTQKHRGLAEFFAGRHIHRFDAEHIGIHALHSLVSSLEKSGLKFDRRTVTVPTRWGADAHVTQYWLASASYQLAARLLGLEPRRHRIAQPDDEAREYLRASGS